MEVNSDERTSLLSALPGREFSTKKKLLLGFCAIWNILLFSLAVSGVALGNKKLESESLDQCISETFETFTTVVELSPGTVVSFFDEDIVTQGGGTTVYLHQDAIYLEFAASNLQTTTIDPSTVIAFYTNGSKGALYYSLGRVLEDGEALWNEPMWSGLNNVGSLQVAILNPNLAVAVCDIGLIVIGLEMFENAYQVSFTPFSAPFTASENTQVCSLSATTFAVSYFAPLAPYAMTAQVGTIVTTPQTNVTWSNAIVYSADDMTTHSVACLFTTHFIVTYYTQGTTSGNFSASLFVVDTNIALVTTVSTTSIFANNYFSSVALSPTQVVVLAENQARSNSLNAVLIDLDLSTNPPLITFGSRIGIGSPNSDQSATNLWTFVSLIKLDLNSFAVAYADFDNRDIVTTTICYVTETNQLELGSPAFPISPGNPNPSKDYYWVSLTPTTQNGILSYIATYSLTSKATPSIGSAGIEVLHKPIGVIVSVADNEATVALFGPCSVPVGVAEVTRGALYYTNTNGNLAAVDVSSATRDYVQSNTQLYSRDSLVGIGLSQNKILLNAK